MSTYIINPFSAFASTAPQLGALSWGFSATTECDAAQLSGDLDTYSSEAASPDKLNTLNLKLSLGPSTKKLWEETTQDLIQKAPPISLFATQNTVKEPFHTSELELNIWPANTNMPNENILQRSAFLAAGHNESTSEIPADLQKSFNKYLKDLKDPGETMFVEAIQGIINLSDFISSPQKLRAIFDLLSLPNDASEEKRSLSHSTIDFLAEKLETEDKLLLSFKLLELMFRTSTLGDEALTGSIRRLNDKL